ncbi:recombination mediator RecR [Patescibacteria group bacterium]|nr:recombination mediator RecR [Patescibacteria group bacterium]MBU1028999.1 recombination mediator RecR [Patescibacteria group bacterium]
MPKFPEPIEQLIHELGCLPGVGPKTAERYAFSLLKRRPEERERLAQTIIEVSGTLTTCSVCGNYTEKDPCHICANPQRDRATICLVATEQDLLAIERTGEFQGLYHVLGGVLSPADGITPTELNIRQLLARLQRERPVEIILAFDHTIEGESTMLYLTRIIKSFDIRITRLARGLPIGSEVGYADEITLTDALKGRSEIKKELIPEKIMSKK